MCMYSVGGKRVWGNVHVTVFHVKRKYCSFNSAVCGCGQDAVLLAVRKEDSVNKGERLGVTFLTNNCSFSLGRQFYSCARREGGCGFFLWADQGDPMSRVPSGPLQQAPANNNSASMGSR